MSPEVLPGIQDKPGDRMRDRLIVSHYGDSFSP